MHQTVRWPPYVAVIALVGLEVSASWVSHPDWWDSHWRGALVWLGVAINLGGISFTLWAFDTEHRGRGLGPLLPKVVARSARLKSWMRRVLRRPGDALTIVESSRDTSWITSAEDPYIWKTFEVEASIEERLSLALENLETLKRQVEDGQARLGVEIAAVAKGSASQLQDLNQRLADQGALDAAITSGAIRRQVVGLVIASVGGLLAAVAPVL